jgi:hypothetical protein
MANRSSWQAWSSGYDFCLTHRRFWVRFSGFVADRPLWTIYIFACGSHILLSLWAQWGRTKACLEPKTTSSVSHTLCRKPRHFRAQWTGLVNRIFLCLFACWLQFENALFVRSIVTTVNTIDTWGSSKVPRTFWLGCIPALIVRLFIDSCAQ